MPEPPSTPVHSSSKLDETLHTPGAAAHTFVFTDNLMDEMVDLSDVSVTSPARPSPRDDSVDVGEIDETREDSVQEPADDDKTIVLPKPVPLSPIQPPATDTPKKGKMRVNTEVERIVAKIWSSAGDLVMPGHAFDTSGTGNGKKPPRAKETMYVSSLHPSFSLTFSAVPISRPSPP
jgi:hypothetical protein